MIFSYLQYNFIHAVMSLTSHNKHPFREETFRRVVCMGNQFDFTSYSNFFENPTFGKPLFEFSNPPRNYTYIF